MLSLLSGDFAPLCLASFAAGLTDSVGGGGGLIQLPALLILLPTASVPTVLGTNKLASIFGTTAAALTYSRKVKLDAGLCMAAAGCAFVLSMLGAKAVTLVSPTLFKPFILVLLIAMAIFTFAHKDFGSMSHDLAPGRTRITRGIGIGLALGFYDGFVGPGTGAVLIFLFIGAVGMDFLNASATAKVVNVATNLAAIIFFAATGHVLYHYAVPMGACNILGGISGAQLAIRRGNRFVRVFFLAVIAAIIGRYGFDLLK